MTALQREDQTRKKEGGVNWRIGISPEADMSAGYGHYPPDPPPPQPRAG